MTMEASHHKLESLPTPSPLVFFLSEDDENMSVCSITNINHINDTKVPDELRGKRILDSFYGWFVLITDACMEVSLWNPLTLEFIGFPLLDIWLLDLRISHCLLTSPPETKDSTLILFFGATLEEEGQNPYSTLILFEETYFSIMCCKVGDKQWTYHSTKEYGLLLYPVMFNRALYAISGIELKLVQMDLSMPNNPQFSVLDGQSEIQVKASGLFTSHGYMVESCGELFLVYFSRASRLSCEVSAVEILRLNFSNMEWKKVENFGDRVFFFNSKSGFSCPIDGSEIEGNGIYFTLDDHKCIYLYNPEDKTISISKLKFKPYLIMTNSRKVRETIDHDLYTVNKEERKYDVKEPISHSIVGEDTRDGDFGKLHLDILFEIGRRLILGDYMNFRSVNKRCWLGCPPTKWTHATLEEFDDYTSSSLSPWLSLWHEDDGICKIFDFLRREWHYINFPNNTSKNVSMCHSVSGWCVMLQGKTSRFLWNPLIKKTIMLPPNASHNTLVRGCTISSSMEQIIFILYKEELCWIEYVYLKKGEWYKSQFFGFDDIEVEMNTNMVLCEQFRDLYVMEATGNVTMLEVTRVDVGEETVIDIRFSEKFTIPCPYIYQSFLMECNGKPLAIFVGFLGEWIRIFKLDYFDQNIWIEIENLENKTIYVSQFSRFWTAPPNSTMDNRVYFPRYHRNSNNIVYYSLKSKKFHIHDTEEVLDNFDNTKIQLFSSWVEQKWH